MTEHAWAEVRFNYATWLECECGYRPGSQEDMDAHIEPPDAAPVKTHSVSEARRIKRVAAAMFNAPDPTDPDWVGSQWPPTHPDDLAWWLTRAEAAINAMKES